MRFKFVSTCALVVGMAAVAVSIESRSRAQEGAPAQTKKNPAAREPAKRVSSISAKPAREQEAERRIRKALRQSVALDFTDAPLSDIATELEKKVGAKLLFDLKALEEASIIPTDTVVTFSCSQMTLDAALTELLRTVGSVLTRQIRHGALVITTTTAANDAEWFEPRVYPIRDFVRVQALAENGISDFDSLVNLITSTIVPDTWGDAPGQGAIKVLADPALLVVAHNGETHEAIADLLKSLRIARAMQDDDGEALKQLSQDDDASDADAASKSERVSQAN